VLVLGPPGAGRGRLWPGETGRAPLWELGLFFYPRVENKGELGSFGQFFRSAKVCFARSRPRAQGSTHLQEAGVRC
jgi:hypothetical protein